MLGKTVATHQTDWPTHLPFVVNAYNTTEHSATGFSPFFLMYGREQNTAIDVVDVTLGGLRAVNCEISLAGAYVTVWCGVRDRVHVVFSPPRI